MVGWLPCLARVRTVSPGGEWRFVSWRRVSRPVSPCVCALVRFTPLKAAVCGDIGGMLDTIRGRTQTLLAGSAGASAPAATRFKA